MRIYQIPLWKTSPFLRLIIPLIIGILIQWYIDVGKDAICLSLIIALISFLLIYFLPINQRFRFRYLQGIFLMLAITLLAMWCTWYKDMHHQQKWFGNFYTDSASLIVHLNEPILIKDRSIKAVGSVEAVINNGHYNNTIGNLILHFQKDST